LKKFEKIGKKLEKIKELKKITLKKLEKSYEQA